jgi:redox-sensitive bicupin YhaK (pirin superfamily)
MSNSFVLRARERGHNRIGSTGATSSYIAGHPDSFITRESSFNFHEYQDGRAGFGRMRVFGDEVFSGSGCGYNMHPHHNFLIAAFVLQGELIHVNTVGNVDQLHQGDYYVFSAGSGAKHAELSIGNEDMHAIYIWFLPDQLYLPPSYHRAHFDRHARRNRIEQLVGDQDAALPIPQDVRISWLISDRPDGYSYRPRSQEHGVYAFVLEGEVRFAETLLGRRDSMGIWDTPSIACETTVDQTEILFISSQICSAGKLVIRLYRQRTTELHLSEPSDVEGLKWGMSCRRSG